MSDAKDAMRALDAHIEAQSKPSADDGRAMARLNDYIDGVESGRIKPAAMETDEGDAPSLGLRLRLELEPARPVKRRDLDRGLGL